MKNLLGKNGNERVHQNMERYLFHKDRYGVRSAKNILAKGFSAKNTTAKVPNDEKQDSETQDNERLFREIFLSTKIIVCLLITTTYHGVFVYKKQPLLPK